VAELAIPLWFSPDFRQKHPELVNGFSSMIEACPPAGYLGCCAALRDEDLREAISRITTPVLAVAGMTDVPTPVEALRFIHEAVSGSKMITLDAAHLSNVEQADAFTSAVMGFLGSL
jgi:3-oxoadipate enol-lactonase